MILVWYNPNLNIFYSKYYKHYMENKYYVGYKNSYDHEVVQIFIFAPDGKLYSVVDYSDYLKKSSINRRTRKSLLNRFHDLIYKKK